jgi:hypothetical protein
VFSVVMINFGAKNNLIFDDHGWADENNTVLSAAKQKTSKIPYYFHRPMAVEYKIIFEGFFC